MLELDHKKSINIHMNTIAQTIKRLRENAGLSQNQLSRDADVSVGFISRLEAGAYKTLSLDKCKNLADGLGIQMRDFLSELGFLQEDEKYKTSNEMIKRALRKTGLNDSDITKVIEYAEFIKNARH